jgi:HK97 family phage prohead protease
MPLKRCETDGQPGWKWGDAGKCYVYTAGDEESEQAARKKAMAQAAAMGEFPGTGDRSSGSSGQVEILTRSDAAVLDNVNFKDRIIDVIAVPWDQEAEIFWRGEVWREVFERQAFDEAIQKSVRIPVNREHSRGDTIGRIVNMERNDQGLLASVKVARTPRGDDTLQLASERMLGGSVGYFVKKPSDVLLERRSMLRRVLRAFMEHFSMVESPAFVGAETVAVHDGLTAHPAAGEQSLITPSLDEWMADDILSWADSRLIK